MQGVPEPRPLTRRIALAAAVLGSALALGACGGGDDDGPKPVKKPEGLPADFNIQLFDCEGWNKATEPVRDYVVRRMHEIGSDQITGPGVRGRGSVLTDEETVAFFDRTCANPRARGFVLYKIYAFARGFRGRAPGGS